MSKFMTMLSISVFLVFTGFSVWADQSDRGHQGMQSDDTLNKREKGSSIDTQNPSSKTKDMEEEKGARPGVAGEEGTTSIFGSPSTMPPSENSPGYTGADKELEEREKQQENR